MSKVLYNYKHCNKEWDSFVKPNRRDRVSCDVCGNLADRQISNFSFVGASYVGTDRFKGAELGLGVKGLESSKDVEKAMEKVGAQPVDAYYRQPAPPPLKELTIEELNEYL